MAKQKQKQSSRRPRQAPTIRQDSPSPWPVQIQRDVDELAARVDELEARLEAVERAQKGGQP